MVFVLLTKALINLWWYHAAPGILNSSLWSYHAAPDIEFVIAIWIKNIPSKSLYGQLAHFKWENWDFSELCTIDYNHMRFLHVLWQFDWAIFEGVVEVWQEWLLFLVIFLTMTVWGLREEWLVILLTIIVRQRNGLCG